MFGKIKMAPFPHWLTISLAGAGLLFAYLNFSGPKIGVGGEGGSASSWFGKAVGGDGGRGGIAGQGGKGGGGSSLTSNVYGGNGGDALQADGTACGGRINKQAIKDLPKEMLDAVPNIRDYGKGGDVGNPKNCP